MAEAKPVQPMTLHWFDLSRVQRYTKPRLDIKSRPRLSTLAERIIELYNQGREEQECYQRYRVEQQVMHSFRRRVWVWQSRGKAAADTQLEEQGDEELQDYATNHRVAIYFRTKPCREMAAVTSGDGGEVVEKCASYTFPITFAEYALDPARIVEIKWASLLRQSASITSLHPAAYEIMKTAYLYRQVEKLRCRVRKSSSLIRLIGKKNEDVIIRIGKRSVRLELRLAWERYPALLKLISSYMRDVNPLDMNKKQERPHRGFEFLRFLQKVSNEHFHLLDSALCYRIYRAYMKEQPLPVMVAYKHLDRFLSAKKYEIQVQSGKRFHRLGKSPPTIEKILELLMPQGRDTSLKEFIKRLLQASLRFRPEKDRPFVKGRLMEFFEGEAQVIDKTVASSEARKINGLKLRGMWYTITEDHLALMHRDFHGLMRRTLIPLDNPAHLPLPWIGNKRQGHVTEGHMVSVAGAGKKIREFKKRFKQTKVCFIDQKGNVLCHPLKGRILKEKLIAKHRAAIDALLASKEQLTQTDLTKACGSEGQEIYKLLYQPRPIIVASKDGKKLYVDTPYAYPLKDDPFLKGNIDALETLLDKRYTLSATVQSEEAYCRSYLPSVHNRGELYGKDRGWLVFDQITALEIELGDLFYYRDGMLFIYQVKEEFGQPTRDACSQLLNAARMVRSAISLNQAEDYLEALWESATHETASKWRQETCSQLRSLGKDFFFDLFRNRRVIFVYAFLPSANQFWHLRAGKKVAFSPEEIASSPELTACQKEGFLDQRGMLTGKFLACSQERFTLKDIEEKKREEIYRMLSEKRAASDSMLAKMDLLHTQQALQEMGFEFAIDVIQRPRGHVIEPSDSEDHSDDDLPLPPSQFTFPSQVFSGTAVVSPNDLIPWTEEGGPRGLRNIGNSCYINATLQILRLMPAFEAEIEPALERHRFLHQNLEAIEAHQAQCQAALQQGEEGVDMGALGAVLKSLTAIPVESTSLTKTRQALEAIINDDGVTAAQSQALTNAFKSFVLDAQKADQHRKKLEACRTVLQLQEDAQQIPSLTKLRDTFYEYPGTATFDHSDGRATQQDAAEFIVWLFDAAGFNSYTYETVKNRVSVGETVTSETGTILRLPVHGGQSLQDLITDYFVPHPVDDNDDILNTQDRMLEAPQQLILQLKRYEYDQPTQTRRKITAPVAMPDDGHLFLPIEQGEAVANIPYEIVGFINHHGNLLGERQINALGEEEMNRGHYTADVQMDGEWFHCDDSTISKRNPHNPKQDAYLILLRRVENDE